MADLKNLGPKKPSEIDPELASTSCNVCQVNDVAAYAFQAETADESVATVNKHLASHTQAEINAATKKIADRLEEEAVIHPERAEALKHAAAVMRASVQD